MGANQSSITQQQATIATTDIVSKAINKFSSSTVITGTTNQTINIIIGKDAVINCPLQINQTASATVVAQVQTIIQNKSNIASDVATNVANTIASQVAQANSQFNILQANAQQTINQIYQDVATNVYTSVENYIDLSLNVSVTSNQTLNFTFNGTWNNVPGMPCEINQQSILATTISNITNSVMDTVMNTKSVEDVMAQGSAAVTQTNEGIDLFKIGIIIAVIMVIGIVGYVIFRVLGKGSSGDEAPPPPRRRPPPRDEGYDDESSRRYGRRPEGRKEPEAPKISQEDQINKILEKRDRKKQSEDEQNRLAALEKKEQLLEAKEYERQQRQLFEEQRRQHDQEQRYYEMERAMQQQNQFAAPSPRVRIEEPVSVVNEPTRVPNIPSGFPSVEQIRTPNLIAYNPEAKYKEPSADIKPLLGSTAHEDVFSTPMVYRGASAPEGPAQLHSVGPDKVD